MLTIGESSMPDTFQGGKQGPEVDVESINDTEWRFDEIVARCRASGAGGYQLGARRVVLSCDDVGPTEYGFKMVRRVFMWVQTRAPAERVACRITDVS